MVGLIFYDRHGSIDLFVDEDASEFVRKSERRESEQQIGAISQAIVVSERAADGESHWRGLVDEFLEGAGELLAFHEFSAFVEDEEERIGLNLSQDLF